MGRKQPDYPNNWNIIQQAPDSVFKELSFEDFYEWRVHGWEIPEPYLCVIRVFNSDTGKVKEYSYKQANAANKKIQQLTTDPANEITIADDEEVTLLRAVIDDGEGWDAWKRDQCSHSS